MNLSATKKWIDTLFDALHNDSQSGYCPQCCALEILENSKTAMLNDAFTAAGDDPHALYYDLVFNMQVMQANALLLEGCIEAVREMFPEVDESSDEELSD
jgi:hypothetical protein